jgi:hypothetical protein
MSLGPIEPRNLDQDGEFAPSRATDLEPIAAGSAFSLHGIAKTGMERVLDATDLLQ